MMIDTLRTGRSHPHPEPISGARYSAAELMPGNQRVALLDQRLLPAIERYELLSRCSDVAVAIKTMVVRGAPAIGVAAAYAMVLAAEEAQKAADFMAHMRASAAELEATRPTAVNLAHAVRAMLALAEAVDRALDLARAAVDRSQCRARTADTDVPAAADDSPAAGRGPADGGDAHHLQ